MSDRQYPSKPLRVVLDVSRTVVLSVFVALSVALGASGNRSIASLVLFFVFFFVLFVAPVRVLNRVRRGSVRSRRERRSASGSALGWAGRLLPDAMKEDYIEEWRAWLSDLQQDGEPWYRRTAELLVIVLVAAPRLAIICRLRPQRTVD